MQPAALLALVALLVVPLFPGDIPSGDAPEYPPVHLSTQTTFAGLSAPADAATSRLVERASEYLRAMRLSVAPDAAGGYLVASEATALSPARNVATAPPRPLQLSVGFNSSSFPAASGAETRFGGGSDAAWRLAYAVQRNLTGGMRDVLGYETYDRGVQERDPAPARAADAAFLSTDDPWVATYPLFSTNSFEAGIMESPGGIEVLSLAVANAVASYLDPSTGSPKRTAQAGWSRSRPWQPVDPKSIYSGEKAERVAFTFDGGASSVPTPAILKALKDAGVRATMFMTADFVERNPDLVVQMARDGHEFGNHTSTHPDMTTISDRAIVAELDKLESAVVALTGKSTRPWFRPPFGAIDDRVMRVVADQGYYSIMWTADSADWRTDIDSATVASRLLRYSEPGAIMIEHLGSPQSAEVLAGVLKALAGRGLSVGSLSEVVGTP